MFSNIAWPSFESFLRGDISFQEAGKLISDLYNAVIQHPNMSGIVTPIQSFFSALGIFSAVILLLISIGEMLYGKKYLHYQLPVIFTVVGFSIGTTLFASLLADAGMKIAPWIVGIVVAIVFALLSTWLFDAIYLFGIGYSTYMVFAGGNLIPDTVSKFMKGNMIIGLVVTIVVIVLVIIFKEWVKLFTFSFIGAYGVAYSIGSIVNQLSGINVGEVVNTLILLTCISLATVFQFNIQKEELMAIFTKEGRRKRRRSKNRIGNNNFLSSAFRSTNSLRNKITNKMEKRSERVKARRAKRRAKKKKK